MQLFFLFLENNSQVHCKKFKLDRKTLFCWNFLLVNHLLALKQNYEKLKRSTGAFDLIVVLDFFSLPLAMLTKKFF